MQRKTFILQILLTLMVAGLVNLSSNIQVGLAENRAGDSYTVYLPVVSNPVLGWQEVGWGSATGGGISLLPGLSIVSSLHINSNGVPYLVYTDLVNGVYTKIHILQWDGAKWVELTATSFSGSYEPPVVAFAPDDTPYVAWQEYSDGNWNLEIYIRRWDGNHWVEVGTGSASGGGISNDLSTSALPTIAFGPDGIHM